MLEHPSTPLSSPQDFGQIMHLRCQWVVSQHIDTTSYMNHAIRFSDDLVNEESYLHRQIQTLLNSV